MSKREEIFELFKTKSCTKQEVFAQTQASFGVLKDVLKELTADYTDYIKKLDNRVKVQYEDDGEYGAVLKFGGDLLAFQMHSNVFTFPKSNPVLLSSYVKEDEFRAFCGVINIYNFLNDSFKYNRNNDYGYLISRIYINKDGHFFAEGKGEMSYHYFDFANQVISKENWVAMVEDAVAYALKFDLYSPPFAKSQLVTVAQMKQLSMNVKVSTGKRLGFRMSGQQEDIV